MTNGALLDQMRQDNLAIITTDFATTITLTDTNDKTASVQGIATLHNTSYSPETGAPVNALNAHVCIAFNTLKDLDLYKDPRNPENIVLKGCKVSFIDAAGKNRVFKCADVRPDYTFGHVTILLTEWRAE